MWVQNSGTGKQVSPGPNYEDKNMEKYGKIGEYSNHLKSSRKCTAPLELKVTEVK
jgi:hypothetical protein